jgi:hypothetical protein
VQQLIGHSAHRGDDYGQPAGRTRRDDVGHATEGGGIRQAAAAELVYFPLFRRHD